MVSDRGQFLKKLNILSRGRGEALPLPKCRASFEFFCLEEPLCIRHFWRCIFCYSLDLNGANERLPVTSNPLGILRHCPFLLVSGWWGWFKTPLCDTDEEKECQRGESYVEQSVDWFSVTAVFCFIVIAVCMILITLRARSTGLRIQQYAGGSTNQWERTRETGKQGMYYTGAFFVTFFPVYMIKILHDLRYLKFYFFFAILANWQGFWNAWIYFHKRSRTLTQQGGSLTFLGRLREIRTSFSSTISDRNQSNRGDVTVILSDIQYEEQDPQSRQHTDDCELKIPELGCKPPTINEEL